MRLYHVFFCIILLHDASNPGSGARVHVVTQRLGKHVPAATNMQENGGIVKKLCFLLFTPRGYIMRTQGQLSE
jgi:hypothetical protein